MKNVANQGILPAVPIVFTEEAAFGLLPSLNQWVKYKSNFRGSPDETLLRLGRGRRRCADGMRRHRRGVLAGGLPGAAVGGDGMVAHRHIARHDDRVRDDGVW